MNIGIIGCGNISHRYIQHIQAYYSDQIRILFVSDIDLDLAGRTAAQYQIPFSGTVDALLAMKDVQLVINLTPPQIHVEVSRRCMEAGKHVFSEKPFALTLKDAKDLISCAQAHHVQINGAPDTYLAPPIQTCRKLIRDRWIGKPVLATANCVSHGMENWHPNPAPFYREGAGPVYDMGGYYLSALVYLLGPVKNIFAFSQQGQDVRISEGGPRKGESFPVETPTSYQAVLRMASGATVNLNLSFDVWKSGLPLMEIYGTEGTLCVPDPNRADGKAKLFRKEQTLNQLNPGTDITNDSAVFYPIPNLGIEQTGRLRGEGVVAMVRAIEDGREADNTLTVHVAEAVHAILVSAASGTVYTMETTC